MNGSGQIEGTLTPVKQALLELRDMKDKVDALEKAKSEPIAIIGLGCRFPGRADSPEAFWTLLREGKCAVEEIPEERWNHTEFYNSNPETPGKIATRFGGFLKEIDQFDAEFFHITAREAGSMDPQQRLLLEVSWEALEQAGVTAKKAAGSSTGVFMGIGPHDYSTLMVKESEENEIDVYTATGNSHSVASGRIAYCFGLVGPAVSVDTACSSSLVAIHLACQSLRTGDCRMALAGGVGLILSTENYISLSKAGVLAPDGRCKTFDANANGFVRSEGCGVAVLKRLSEALADGDRVWAVIRGSAINQDGRSNGLTAPNGPSQVAVIRAALANAQVDPLQVSYIETHGTGTELGDPIEVQALGEAYCAGRDEKAPLILGSSKTNLGHMEAAAGIGGFIKTVLMLQNRQIPPHLHFQTPNPHIAWNEYAMEVSQGLQEWRSEGKRLAGLSSFGFSGTNVHILLEEAVELDLPATRETTRAMHVLSLSTQSESALKELGSSWAAHLEKNTKDTVHSLCFSSNTGRTAFNHRAIVLGNSKEEIRSRLQKWIHGEACEGIYQGRCNSIKPEIVFLFSGQGSQYAGMGRELYQTQPRFRKILEQCQEILKPNLDLPLLSVMYPVDEQSHLIHETRYAQPALFSLEYAMYELWKSWGIEPAAVAGHSLGEYAAACAAGVMTWEEGLKLVAERGRLMHSLPSGGSMAAVFADEEIVRAELNGRTERISIAAVNSPANTVISGETDLLQDFLIQLKEKGIPSKQLQIANAYHSPAVEPILHTLKSTMEKIQFKEPVIDFASNRTGQICQCNDIHAEYWTNHLRETVQFAQSIRTLCQKGYRIFVEIGPHTSLLGMASETLQDKSCQYIPSLRRNQDDWSVPLSSLGQLYCSGVDVDWDGFHQPDRHIRVSIPTYPYRKESHWFRKTKESKKKTFDCEKQWECLLERFRMQAHQIPSDLPLRTYAYKWEILDRMATAYIIRTLKEIGAFQSIGDECTVERLIDEKKIIETYQSLLSRWLNKLCEEGLAQKDRQTYRWIQNTGLESIAELEEQALLLFEDAPFLLEYVVRCGSRMTEIVAGQANALDTLFPNGSMELAEQLYHRWALSRYYNVLVGSIAERILLQSRLSEKVRILEIGAGTGGTTASILPQLPPDRVEYFYTDVSDYFLNHAQERFRRFPFIQYRLLNIEIDSWEQGFSGQSFDIIIAANCLHATKNMHTTMDHVHSLLKPGGAVILYEFTHPPSWFDTTIALIEGWQRFEDDLRVDNPLLCAEEWKTLLAQHRFEGMAEFPKQGDETEILGAHVIVARKNEKNVTHTKVVVPQLSATSKSNTTHLCETIKHNPIKTNAFQIGEWLDLAAEERFEFLVETIKDCVRSVIRRDSSKSLDRNHRLMEYGLDSLMAVELKTLLEKTFQCPQKLPSTLMFDYPTVEAIAEYMERHLCERFENSSKAGDDASDCFVNRSLNDIDVMSEDEAANLLLSKLEAISGQ